MPASTHPNLPIKYGWTLGESAWNTDMDANIKMLGALVGCAVKDRDLTAPPGSPVNGDRYLIAAGATGAWAGKDGQIAVRVSGAWEYYIPLVGWLVYVEDESLLVVKKLTGWSAGLVM